MIDPYVKALEDYYQEYGEGKSLEYTYGYMDALAALRDSVRQNAPFVTIINHPAAEGNRKMRNPGALEKEITRLLRDAEPDVLETVYYILRR